MQNLITSLQAREADAHTIRARQITSAELMEAAARAFIHAFINEYPDRETPVSIYCGTGNNGGDGLAIARLLKTKGYRQISVKIAFFNNKNTTDFEANLSALLAAGLGYEKLGIAALPHEPATVIIDALLGSGLSRPLEGAWSRLVDYLNRLNKDVVAVDVPTGFPAEGVIPAGAVFLKSRLVITFQRPAINFFMPESAAALDRFITVNIGLDEDFIEALPAQFKLLDNNDISKLLRPRFPFSHKGTYGHALIIAGKNETMGAALLCAGACLYTGAGLTTAYIPPEGLTALNTRWPEVMAVLRKDGQATLPDMKQYTAVAAGPGLGTGNAAEKLVERICRSGKPAVLDADALNIMAKAAPSLKFPRGAVLTPHMKEFDRLFGAHQSWWHRLETARSQAAEHDIIIVLKNRFTFIVSPGKAVLINPTGSPAMSTGGMGDVLTGMIASFLAQGYEPEHAAVLGTYIHGLCGERYEGYVCTASELIRQIPLRMAAIRSK